MNLVTVHMQAELTGRREITPEGYLRAPARILKEGVFPFTGKQLDEVDAPDETFGVYFDGDYLFDERSLESLALKPVTLGHPPANEEHLVKPESYNYLARGHAGSIVREGEYLETELLITDPETIAVVQSGNDELSTGFKGRFERREGMFNGRPYQFALSTIIQGNHIAVVPTGRAGADVRVMNEAQEAEMDPKDKNKEEPNDAEGTHEVHLRVTAEQAQPPAEEAEAPKQDEALALMVAEQVQKVVGETLPETLGSVVRTQLEELLAERLPAEKASVEDEEDTPPAGESPAGDELPEGAKALTEEETQDLVRGRTVLVLNASPFLPDDADPHTMSDRDILLAATKDIIDDGESRSDDYLRAVLDQRAESESSRVLQVNMERERISGAGKPSKVSAVAQSLPRDFIALRQQRRSAGKSIPRSNR